MEIEKKLKEMSEEGYRRFTSGLIPEIPEERILGVRIPELRKLSRKMEDRKEFLHSLPHHYLDENNLHAIMISNIEDQDETIREIERFLPYVDNWETSDIMNPASLRKDLGKTNSHAHEWLQSRYIYSRRYAITTFMKFFLDIPYLDEMAMEEISRIGDDDYYVKMASSWYWAEALYRCPGTALTYFEKDQLDPWIRRKAIQKARESKKISKDLKSQLQEMKKGEDQPFLEISVNIFVYWNIYLSLLISLSSVFEKFSTSFALNFFCADT